MKRLQAFKYQIQPNGEQLFSAVGISGIHAGEDVKSMNISGKSSK